MRHAVHWQGVASISNPLEVTRAYAALFNKHGGVILKGDARSIHRNGRHWRVETAEGPIDANDVVMALGPFAPDVLDRVELATTQERLMAWLSTVFGGLALMLATIGLYGVMAYTVARRRAEFGVRLALGASAARVKRLVLGESLTLIGGGITAGLIAAAAAARAVSHMVFGIAAIDPVAFAVAAGILGFVAVLAAYLPARQASRVDPIVALRQE